MSEISGSLRNSGIPLIDDVPWGSHLCVFYETKDDLFEAAGCYLDAGLKGHELCVWRLPPDVDIDAARDKLREKVDDFDGHLSAGHIHLVATEPTAAFDRAAVERFWLEKLKQALASGFVGLRGCGDSASTGREPAPLVAYEHDLHTMLADQPVLALCMYSLARASALDVFEVVRLHHVTVARREGQWQFMETPELQRAHAQVRNLNDALALLSRPFARGELLTERERMVLAFMVKGASSKEAARALGISPRTVDFHRANIMEKLGARNTADAVRRVLQGR